MNVTFIKPENVKKIQQEIDRFASIGGGTVILAPGIFALQEGIKLKSNIRIIGSGKCSTLLVPADPSSFNEPFLTVTEGDKPCTENLVLKDFSIDGFLPFEQQAFPEKICRDFKKLDNLGAQHLRMGAYFTDEFAGTPFKNIEVSNVDVKRCSNGMHILSTDGCSVSNCHFDLNGCVIQHHHNIYFRRCSNVVVKNVTLSNSPHGVGLNLGNGCSNVILKDSTIYGNGYRGVRFDGLESLSTDISLLNCVIYNNVLRYDEPAVRVHTVKGLKIIGNVLINNRNSPDIFVRNSRKGEVANNIVLHSSRNGCVLVEKCDNIKESGNVTSA